MPKNYLFAISIIIVVLTFLIYGNTISHGYNLDDEYITTSLPSVESGLKGCFEVFNSRFDGADYRPISIFTFSIEQLVLGKQNVHFSHFVNVLIYTLCCLLLFLRLSEFPSAVLEK